MADNDVALSPHELEILQQFENASRLRETINTPGWDVFLRLRDKRIEQLKEQFIHSKVDKDSLWAMQIRLDGIISFFDVWLEGVMTAVEALDPVVVRQAIEASRMRQSELDGEPGLIEL